MDRRPHTTHTQLSDHDSRSEALLDVCQIVLQGLCLELDEVALHISTELGRPSFVQVMVCVCELSKSKMDGWMDGFITVFYYSPREQGGVVFSDSCCLKGGDGGGHLDLWLGNDCLPHNAPLDVREFQEHLCGSLSTLPYKLSRCSHLYCCC